MSEREQFVVLQWYYNEREGKCILPELIHTIGPFSDRQTASEWIDKASTWGGWGKYEYQISEMYLPYNNEENS